MPRASMQLPAPPPNRRRRSRATDAYDARLIAYDIAPERDGDRRGGGDLILAALRQVQMQQEHLGAGVDEVREQVGGVRTFLAQMAERQENVGRTLDDHASRLAALERERGTDRVAAERERGADRVTFAQEVARAIQQGQAGMGKTAQQASAQAIALYGVIVAVLLELVHLVASGHL